MSTFERSLAVSMPDSRSSKSTSISSQSTVRGARPIRISLNSDNTAYQPFSAFTFEKDLDGSRVYQRAGVRGPETFSIATSTQLTQSWSMLSGLSLSEISNIAVQKLPIYEKDLKNSDLYFFGDVDEESTLDGKRIYRLEALDESADTRISFEQLPIRFRFPAPPSSANTTPRKPSKRNFQFNQGRQTISRLIKKSPESSPGFLSPISELRTKDEADDHSAACYANILMNPMLSPSTGCGNADSATTYLNNPNEVSTYAEKTRQDPFQDATDVLTASLHRFGLPPDEARGKFSTQPTWLST